MGNKIQKSRLNCKRSLQTQKKTSIFKACQTSVSEFLKKYDTTTQLVVSIRIQGAWKMHKRHKSGTWPIWCHPWNNPTEPNNRIKGSHLERNETKGESSHGIKRRTKVYMDQSNVYIETKIKFTVFGQHDGQVREQWTSYNARFAVINRESCSVAETIIRRNLNARKTIPINEQFW